MESRPITLSELLESRDNRRANQLRILNENKGATLIVATVVIPGNVKRTDDSLAIAEAADKAIKERFGAKIKNVLSSDLPTGFESYYISASAPDETKALTVSIEDSHPLGRMMDIDVFDPEGNQISRADRGETARKCLLCDNDARICMRAFTHSQEELLDEIHRRVVMWHSSCSSSSEP